MIAQGILATARSLGMNPLDLATIISYETSGTFNPTKAGPTTKWGQHRGLIQFGVPQAKKFGVDWANPEASQLGPNGAVAKYFRASGWKPGMGLLDAYSIVNAGAPGRYNASDARNGGAPGTVRDKVEKQMGSHKANAAKLLGSPGNLPSMSMGSYRMPQIQFPGMQPYLYPYQPTMGYPMGGGMPPSYTRQSPYQPQQQQDDFNPFAKHLSAKNTPVQQDVNKPADDFNPFAKHIDARAKLTDQPAAKTDGIVSPNAPGFNPNPLQKRDTLTTADMPQQDALVALGSGVLRGLEDAGAGVVRLNDTLANTNPLTLMTDLASGGNASKPRNYVSNRVDEANRASIAAFDKEYGNNKTAGFGRIVGNTLPFTVPGTQLPAVSGVLPNIARGAATGALNNAVIGSGRNPDSSVGKEAVVGAVYGGVGSTIGAMLPKSINAIKGINTVAADGSKEAVSKSAIQRLIEASGPDMPIDAAAARLQGAIRQGNTTLVPGASPTTAQAAMLPGVSQTQRDILNFGQGQLADKLATQEQARIAALGNIADTSGLTAQDAAEAAGQRLSTTISNKYAAAKARTSKAYNNPNLQSLEVQTQPGAAAKIYNDAFMVGGHPVGGSAALKQVVDALESKDKLVFSDLQKLRAASSGIANQASVSGDKNLSRVATQLTEHIDGLTNNNALFAAAKAARARQGDKFETGWVRDITRTGSDGMPRLSGAQVARGAFSPASDQVERMAAIKPLLGQQDLAMLKQYAMADLGERAIKNGAVSSNISGYVNKRSGALNGLLAPDEMATLNAIKQDVERRVAADGLGKAVGSNTIQNKQGALNLGLLDSPLANFAVGKIPLGGAALQSMREYQRKQLANNLGGLLSNPQMTDQAITEYLRLMRQQAAGANIGGLLSAPAGQGLLDR